MNDDPSRTMQVLDIYSLHIRHPGMARGITDNYAVNAAVCMQRHSRSPRVWTVQHDEGALSEYLVAWERPTADQIRSCANRDDATRDGAYGLALAAADAYLGLVALRRAEGRSGSDFYVISAGADVSEDPDEDVIREDLIRLEVSGVDDDNDVRMRARLGEKVHQALQGKSPHPAIASVVGFRTARVMFRTAED